MTAHTDTFRGDNAALVSNIRALIDLDAAGALRPHGLGGHAKGLLAAAAARLFTGTLPGARDDQGPRYTVADKDLNALLEFTDWLGSGGTGHDLAMGWAEALENVMARLVPAVPEEGEVGPWEIMGTDQFDAPDVKAEVCRVDSTQYGRRVEVCVLTNRGMTPTQARELGHALIQAAGDPS